MLAAREPRPLDLALIDGAHGFPYPVLDWWYLAPQIKIGGLVVLDDAYMPPVGMIVDFLRRSPAWEVLPAIGYRTVPVRKLADGLPPFDWEGERLGGGLSFDYLPAGQRIVASPRHRFFSSRAGLWTVGFLRRHAGFLFR